MFEYAVCLLKHSKCFDVKEYNTVVLIMLYISLYSIFMTMGPFPKSVPLFDIMRIFYFVFRHWYICKSVVQEATAIVWILQK